MTIRDRAEREANRRWPDHDGSVSALNRSMTDNARITGFIAGAQWADDQLPTRDQIAAAIHTEGEKQDDGYGLTPDSCSRCTDSLRQADAVLTLLRRDSTPDYSITREQITRDYGVPAIEYIAKEYNITPDQVRAHNPRHHNCPGLIACEDHPRVSVIRARRGPGWYVIPPDATALSVLYRTHAAAMHAARDTGWRSQP